MRATVFSPCIVRLPFGQVHYHSRVIFCYRVHLQPGIVAMTGIYADHSWNRVSRGNLKSTLYSHSTLQTNFSSRRLQLAAPRPRSNIYSQIHSSAQAIVRCKGIKNACRYLNFAAGTFPSYCMYVRVRSFEALPAFHVQRLLQL